jgi:cell division GTPase FtsZ
MLKFGILGIGQGGSNLAEYAYTQGFKAVIANTAQVDLDQIKYIPGPCKIHLGGMGAGRSREVGMQAMIEHAEQVLEKCQEEFKECDAVFVAGTGGGGTGSGGLPVGLEILLSFHKYVGAIIVLPDDLESPKAKMNTLECFSQISEFENLGSVFILDNERAREIHPTVSRKLIYSLTNKELINMLIELNQLTDQPSYVSNFDACDFLSIIQERGFSLISKAEFYTDPDDNKFDIAKRIRESWSKVSQPIFNDNQIMKAAILGIIDEKVSPKIDVSLIFQETGIPYDFNDVYFQPEIGMMSALSKKTKAFVYTIFSGLSFPESRLGKMNESLRNIEERLVTNMNKSQNQKFETEQWNSKFNNKKVISLESTKQDRPAKIDLTSKLAKFK